MKTTKAPAKTATTMSRSPWTPSGRNRIEGIKPTVTKGAKGDKVHRSQDSLSSTGSNSSKPSRSKSLRTNTTSLQSSKEELRRITNKENLTVGRSRLGSRTGPIVPLPGRVAGRNGAAALSRPVTSLSTPLVPRRRMNSGVARGPASGDAATDDRNAGDAVVAELQKNKRALEHQVSELVRNAESKKAEIAQLKMELNKLKDDHRSPDEHLMQEQFESLQDENRVLKERLLSCSGSLDRTAALSDTEKELLLLAKCNSAPPSIIGLTQDGNHIRPPLVASKSDGGGSELDLGEASGTLYPSLTADWDKQSSSSLSEMSVACLQDRILQMEETHYSTNEELQATLQELTDLQDQLTELQAENERLAEEKAVLLESLCSQTEKLEDCRSTNDNLRQLLLEQSDSGTASGSEREGKLLELLKSAQEEKESLVSQLTELRAAVENAHEDESRTQDELTHLQERVTLLQSIVDGANSDKRLLEKQLAESKEQVADAQIEMNRTKTQLENERIKVIEMQQAREAADKSELDEMLDNARKEKDRAEAEAAMLAEQLAVSRCESSRLKESLGILQEEMMVAKNNAKKQISDLEYRLDQVNVDMESARNERQALQDHIHELECKCQRHLEDKRELRAAISDLKNKVKETEQKSEAAEKSLVETRKTYETEMREWKQFQEDLLMTVRVANDFKTEAQHDLERLVLENRQYKDKVSSLQAELDKLKSAAEPAPVSTATQRRVLRPVSNIENPVLCSVEQEMVSMRRPSRSDSRPLSVKSLIESIESAAKQAKAQNGSSRSSSTSSINSAVSEKSPSAVPQIRKSEDIFIKPPLRSSMSDNSSVIHDQNSSLSSVSSSQPSSLPEYSSCKSMSSTDRSSMSPSNKVSSDTESNKTIPSPISILSNKLEPMRRNSYSDILDKKDPLVSLVKGGGSKRNALLKWCQNKTVGYKGIDITNFSSSWNDGLALCAVLHTYLPDKIPYDELDNKDKRRNFTLAFKAAESVGIPCNLNISEMISIERPDWQAVMAYVTCIYKHFET